MFGLTNSEANHGEDVKEYYFYLDSTPTHSYMKYLYKYPQAEYPYADLIETNKRRNQRRLGVPNFWTPVSSAEMRYFDVFVEVAKQITGGPHQIQRKSIAGRRRPHCVSCRPYGYHGAYLDMVARHTQAVPEAGLWSGRRSSCCSLTRRSGRSLSPL